MALNRLGTLPGIIGVFCLCLPAAAEEPGSALRRALEEDPRAEFRYLGVSSCAASNCHGGGLRTQGVAYSSYLHWWQKDEAHRDAFRVLKDELSEQIMRGLSPREAEPAKAEKDTRCLACHATGVTTPDDLESLQRVPFQNAASVELEKFDRRFQLSDGVQCEACHGPAEKWIALHTRPEWLDESHPQHWSAERKFRETGFVPLGEIEYRAKVCAECHVGSRDRDMNHDMIAAGHPRLDFEFATFHSRMPAHWDTRRDAARVTGLREQDDPQALTAQFEARGWVVGQLGSAIQSLELLESRAADEQRVWPEFGESSCYACHHSLQSPSWRQGRASRGEYPWGEWHFSMLPVVIAAGAPAHLEQTESGIAGLQSVMKTPFPNRQQVTNQARQLRGELMLAMEELARQRRTTGPMADDKMAELFRRAIAQTENVEVKGWDAAAQIYLSLVALRAGAPLASTGELSLDQFDSRLRDVRKTLLFNDSSAGSTLNSPVRWRKGLGPGSPNDPSHDHLQVWVKLRRGLQPQ